MRKRDLLARIVLALAILWISGVFMYLFYRITYADPLEDLMEMKKYELID